MPLWAAESLALVRIRDPACFHARLALVEVRGQLGSTRATARLRDPFETTLVGADSRSLQLPGKLAGEPIVAKARIIKDIGNVAVHETRAVSPDKAVAAIRELFHVAYWLTRTYAAHKAETWRRVWTLLRRRAALPRTTQVAAADA